MRYKQGSRIQMHGAYGASLQVPTQEDFTLAATAAPGWDWDESYLCDREIGVLVPSKEVYIRIGDEIKQIATYPILATQSLPDTDVWTTTEFGRTSGDEALISFTFSNVDPGIKAVVELYVKPNGIGDEGFYHQGTYETVIAFNTVTEIPQIIGQTDTIYQTTEGAISASFSATGSSFYLNVNDTTGFDTYWKVRYKLNK